MASEPLEPRRFQALVGEWTSEELGRFFWLTPADLLQVRNLSWGCEPTGVRAQPALAAVSTLPLS